MVTNSRRGREGCVDEEERPRTPRALIVDDAEGMRAYLATLFETRGFDVDTCDDGGRALNLLESGADPDVILLDVMMPRMSGFEVCQKLKTNPETREIVVIMVTALHEVADYERAVESGTDDFLSKPVNKLELLTRVRSLLRVALLRRKLDDLMDNSPRR